MSRKDVAVLLSQELSVLNARNAMALLELHFLQRNESRGMPSFVKGHGSLMGPGALAASNLLSSELKGHNISSGSRVDVLRNYQKSTIVMKKIRRMFAAERLRLKRLCVRGSELRVQRDQLVAACDEILAMTDTGLEFVVCELAKLVDCVGPTGLHERHRRR